MSGIGFEFPKDSADQWDGFNDPGMEHFAGSPFQHLGREVPQNAIDAKDPKVGQPVKIKISARKISTESIPDVATLRTVMDLCGKAAEADGDEKPTKFFAEAAALLKRKEITILQIADFNTTGVKGPCVNGKPFHAMMKATGQSKKATTSTGSYGIGKFAPYTVSALRTVFLTTVWQDEQGKHHHYVQGKSVLMSHVDAKGKTRRGTGFWGQTSNCGPITELMDILPDWLVRCEDGNELSDCVGTTLSIVGFVAKKGWQDVLAANIVENFFGAIYRGDLEVEIEGSHYIDRTTLEETLQSEVVKKAIGIQDGEPEKFENVAHYLRALKGEDEVFVVPFENSHLGECELRILVGEDLPKKVAILRNGMLITDSLPRLKRFSDFKEFAAVLECTASKGQALLRAMEPPRHDAFEPDRLPRDSRDHGRVALADMTGRVRELLKRYAQDPSADVTTLDELADFFADEAEDGVTKVKDENPGGSIIVRARPLKPAKVQGGSLLSNGGVFVVNDPDGLGGDDEGPESNDFGDGQGGSDDTETGDGVGPNSGGTSRGKPNDADGGDDAGTGGAGGSSTGGGSKKPGGAALPLRNVRAIPLGNAARRIAFTPPVSGTVCVVLQQSGADADYPLAVAKTSSGTVVDGVITGVKVTANQRCVVDVTLAADFDGTIKVMADAV